MQILFEMLAFMSRPYWGHGNQSDGSTPFTHL